MPYGRFNPGRCCGCQSEVETTFCNKCSDNSAAKTYRVVISGGTAVDGTYFVTPEPSADPGSFCQWSTPYLGLPCGLNYIRLRIYNSLFGAPQKLVDVLFLPAFCTVEGNIPTNGNGTTADCIGELNGKVLNVRNTCGAGCGLNNAIATVAGA